MFEKVYHRADRDVRDREARSEREKRVLRDEIRRLKFASLKVAKVRPSIRRTQYEALVGYSSPPAIN